MKEGKEGPDDAVRVRSPELLEINGGERSLSKMGTLGRELGNRGGIAKERYPV